MGSARQVRLEPVDPGCSELYRRWINDPETHRWMLSGHTPISAEEERRIVETMKASDRDEVYEIRLPEEGDLPVGLVGIHRIDPTHRSGEIGITIGEAHWRGCGVGMAAIRAVLDRAFGGLSLNTVYLTCIAENTAGLRLYERAGFTRIGVARGRYLLHDRFRDAILFDMTRADWERARP